VIDSPSLALIGPISFEMAAHNRCIPCILELENPSFLCQVPFKCGIRYVEVTSKARYLKEVDCASNIRGVARYFGLVNCNKVTKVALNCSSFSVISLMLVLKNYEIAFTLECDRVEGENWYIIGIK